VLTTRDLGFHVPGLSPWPSIAYAALAATAGMAVAVLLWAEALDTTLATNITGGVVIAIIVGGGLAIERHQRRHISRLLADHER
jgi:predicted lysophospholipase L1 biosynthesis ABC-type transport system permease subunit